MDTDRLASTVARRVAIRLSGGTSLGLWAGAAGGALAGLAESVAAWGPSAQYLPELFGRLRLLVFLCSLEALAGGIFGAALGFLSALLWYGSDLSLTAVGLWRRGGTTLFAWTIASLLAAGGAAVAIARYALYAQLHFKNRALIAQSVGGVAVLIVLAACLLAFPVQRLVRGVAVRVRWTASRWASVGAFGATAAVLLIVWLIVNRETVAVLSLRRELAGTVFLAGAITSAALARRAPFPRRSWSRRLAHTTMVVCALLLTLASGASDAVRKAAAQYSAFGELLTSSVRALADLDRDGYASILGGGDCNDLDARTKKAFYKSNRNGQDPRRLDFEADVPLWPGENYVQVVARENPQVQSRHTLVVLRSSGNTQLARPSSPAPSATAH